MYAILRSPPQIARRDFFCNEKTKEEARLKPGLAAGEKARRPLRGSVCGKMLRAVSSTRRDLVPFLFCKIKYNKLARRLLTITQCHTALA